MSKKSWYKRKHQFTPYTKADGQAVSDEFDAVQASFERIPEMRDDGKGFKESPLIPTPTDPMHPVPLKMLTETEKSVNNARDDVTDKAQQVAQNTQSVATNTLTATQKADTATQAAASAQSSQQAASNSENMAHKWAANPVNEVVQGDQYSAYHYAIKAAQSETTASSAAITSKNNADIATSKAEEAAQSAEKARSIADGEVEYTKILHVPSADTRTKGIVMLTNDTGLNSEELGLTAKAGKLLAQGIATLRLALNNYIPLKSRSSSVTSDDENGVATPKAVKIAYDKGVDAKETADNANNNANGRVSKSGDMMTGSLAITGSQSGGFASGLMLKNKAGGQNTSVFVDFYQTDNIPRASMWMRDAGNNSTKIEFLNTPEGANWDRDSRQTVFTITSSGNLWSKAYGWLHELYHKHTNAYVAVTEGGGNIAGLDIRRNDGKLARIELFNKKWKFWIQDKYEIYMPEKGGVVALIEDFTYQKIGNFEVRKYPDGTMIQTNVVNFRGGYSHGTVYYFNWAVSFVEAPTVFGSNKAVEDFGFVDKKQMGIKTKSTGSTYYYYLYDPGGEQGDWDMQFLAIGRWKR